MITIYQYVASNRLSESIAICNKYGYSISGGADWQQVAQALEDLVSQDGSAPFYDIISLHPDKEVLSEVYGQKETSSSPSTEKKCGCESNKAVNEYVNAAGSQTGFHLQQGNIFLIAAALLLSVAVIVSSKK